MAIPNPLAKGEVEILKAALHQLRGYGLGVEIDQDNPRLGPTRADALVRMHLDGQEALYLIEIKRRLTTETLGAAIPKLRALGQATLLVTDYVNPQLADRLKALNIAFADAAGNVYLRSQNLFIWVTGRRLEEATKPVHVGRAFQPGGLQLIFALLCNPRWTEDGYRELAARVGIANGTVGWVMRDLEEQGFLIKPRRRVFPRKLRNRKDLLNRWVEGYMRTLRPATLTGRYRAEIPDWWRTLDLQKYHAQLGGEPAAEMVTQFLKPGVVTLYVDGPPGALLLDNALRAAPDGNVELRKKFWRFEIDGWDKPTLVPPLLIYADLLATGDARCIETAQRIYDGHLVRLLAED